ncbi:Serine/threonine-protein kinase [Nymphaea thermarum]|nr:Serine/threonine-protein kinase [Nymphaea thermarum]
MDPRGGGDGGHRMIGDYILGPKIGSGSFAVAWRSWHVRSGSVVAVKEIDRKQLSAKLNESLLKEITILGEIWMHDVIEGLLGCMRLFPSKKRAFHILKGASGILRPGSYGYSTDLI